MKFRVFTLALFASGSLATAQEPPLPAATSTPSPNPSVRPELNIPDIPMTVEPSPLVPNTSPAPKKTVPSIQELDTAFQHSSMGQAVENQRLHLEWRKLKNRTAQNPEVVAAKKAADAAPTELEKRELMRTYYKIFYGRMLALAESPDLKAYLEQRKAELINSLEQPHVRPQPTARPKATP